jgi:pimeloyl-ACP methyl ester carboxylesterase
MAHSDSKSSPDAVQFADVEHRGTQVSLEYSWVFPDNPGRLIVFLHEGLGSVAMWRKFPQALCAAVGCRGLVYSRSGYGESSPLWPDRSWPIEFMHAEARELLPGFLAAVGVDTALDPPVLLGHSDGASIALIYAAAFPSKLLALITAAPHIFVENITVASIAQTRQKFIDTDLPRRLQKYHHDAERVFWGWAGVWLDPDFLKWNIEPLLENVICPVLAVQGYDDEYGTMRQIDGVHSAIAHAQLLKLESCGHSPHIDQPGRLIDAVSEFLGSIPSGSRCKRRQETA